jgi:hypothetical protein
MVSHVFEHSLLANQRPANLDRTNVCRPMQPPSHGRFVSDLASRLGKGEKSRLARILDVMHPMQRPPNRRHDHRTMPPNQFGKRSLVLLVLKQIEQPCIVQVITVQFPAVRFTAVPFLEFGVSNH